MLLILFKICIINYCHILYLIIIIIIIIIIIVLFNGKMFI